MLKKIINIFITPTLIFSISMISIFFLINSIFNKDSILDIYCKTNNINNIEENLIQIQTSAFINTGLPKDLINYINKEKLVEHYKNFLFSYIKYNLGIAKSPEYYNLEYQNILKEAEEKYPHKIDYSLLEKVLKENSTLLLSVKPMNKPIVSNFLKRIIKYKTLYIFLLIYCIINLILLLINKDLLTALKKNIIGLSLNSCIMFAIYFIFSKNLIFKKPESMLISTVLSQYIIKIFIKSIYILIPFIFIYIIFILLKKQYQKKQ